MRFVLAVLLATTLVAAPAWAQTAPPKSFDKAIEELPSLSNTDLSYIAGLLDKWSKESPEVAQLVQLGATNPVLFQSLLQIATLIHLADLARWSKLGALSTYAKIAPDSPVLDAIARCYAENMKNLEAFKSCIEKMKNDGRGKFVQEQLGFQTGTLLATVFTVADDLALVKKYVFDWQVDSTSGRHVQASKPSTMRLRFDEIREGIWPKLGSADGTCDKPTVPTSITINKGDVDKAGNKPFLLDQTLDVDQDVYLEAMSDASLCKKLADVLTVQAVETEAQTALDKLGAREIKSLNEREQARLEYEIAYLQRERGLWNASAWVMDRAYPAFRDRVRKMEEDRFKQVQEMTGGRK